MNDLMIIVVECVCGRGSTVVNLENHVAENNVADIVAPAILDNSQ